MRLRPELAAESAAIRGRIAARATAGARPNPALTVTPEHVSRTDAPISWSLGVALDLLCWQGERRERQLAIADQEITIAWLERSRTIWRIYSEVRDAATQRGFAERELELSRQQQELAARLAALVATRVAAGAASRGERSAAELAAGRAELEIARSAAQLEQATARLAAAVGVAPAELARHRLALADVAAPLEAELPVADAADRLDLRVTLAEYEAAERQIELEVAKQWPELHLGPGWQYDQGERHFQLAVGVELPLFDRNEGPIAAAVARRDAVAARFRMQQAAALAAMDEARASLAAARAERTLLAKLQLEQARRERQASRQVASGAADRPQEIETRQAGVELAREQLAADRALAAAVAQFEEARQRPLDPRWNSTELEPIDG
ncbi:MAG: TolC family protein [Planctomycetes bacterium]|nr:TolC family protein [Planctomycetota bacterium]